VRCALVARLNCRQRGLTDRNRSPAAVRRRAILRLVSLPETLVAAAAKRRNPVRAALLVQTAVAIEVLLNTPIRLRNLCGLRFDRHFDQCRPGRKGVVHLIMPAEEVKNNEPLEFELPASVTHLLTLYRKRHLPCLVDGAPIFVFPGRNGGPKHVVTLSGQIVKAIRRNAGLIMTVHAFRHVAVIRPNPVYALVSRLLGHKSIQTTLSFYAGFESKAAGRAYDREILRLRGNKSGSSRRG
jgi:integrase